MRIVSVTYVNALEYNQPQDWILFIKPYLGVMEELGKHHTVFCVEQINYKGQYSNSGIHYEFLDYGKRINRFPFRLHRFIRDIKPDVVFVRGLHFPLQVILLRRALGNKVKIIVQHHAGKPPGGLRRMLFRKADRSINTYFFSASGIAEEWVKTGVIRNKNKVREIGMLSSFFYPVERDKARQVTGVTGSPVFLWVGQLNSNKDPLTVVKAFVAFAKINSSVKLYLLFQDSSLLGEIEAVLKTSTCPDCVVLVGKVSHEKLLNWYNSADFFIAGSHTESYGAALSEAMSCGCIPVVTNIPSFRKMTREGECGLLYEPGNEKALLAILNKTLELNIEKERSRVLRQFEDELSFAAISKKINRVLDEGNVNP